MTPGAVVFDLDYTLAVPERDRAALLSAAAAATDAPPLAREDYRAAHRATDHGATREPIFAALLADADTDRDDTGEVDPAAVAAAYRDAVADAMRPVDGAETLLLEVGDRWPVGLLTDGPARAGRSKLRALGWERRFDAALVTGEIGADKPDPRGFAAICDRLGVAPERAVYVGDSPELDVAGATEAGMTAVQVLYDGGPAPDPRAAATVERARLATALPDRLAALDADG